MSGTPPGTAPSAAPGGRIRRGPGGGAEPGPDTGHGSARLLQRAPLLVERDRLELLDGERGLGAGRAAVPSRARIQGTAPLAYFSVRHFSSSAIALSCSTVSAGSARVARVIWAPEL
ncbi:hypothetical protein GCM10020367_35240 [Streptomyces sannanensis]|uniref:Uncharacterized protein n=1 Tax=Streptomyces sannanensis TaxID=285536 RepID=A0ABP6SDG0_9ACTN